MRAWVWALVGFLGLGSTALLVLYLGQPGAKGGSAASRDLPVLGQLPEFSLVERGGEKIELADLRGKVWVANFVFTNCTGPCPLLSAQMQSLQGPTVGLPNVRLVSISVDPDRDTPEALSAYADRFGADPDRWMFLTGHRHAVYGLIREGFKLGVQAAGGEHREHSEAGQILHSLRFALVDTRGRLRRYYDGTDPQLGDRLLPDVKRLAEEGIE